MLRAAWVSVALMSVCGLLLAACGGNSSAATAPPAGAASAQITFAGDPSIAGPVTIIGIKCLDPRLDGLVISLAGVPNGQPANGFGAYIDIRAGGLAMTVGSGGGPTLLEREFKGSGTTGFNAATGVRLDASVSDVTGAQFNKGTIGTITRVTGSVSCGNQTNGTSTVTVTGSSADGPIDITTSHFRVSCATGSSGTFVHINGVTTVNGVRVLDIISIGANTISLAHDPEHGAGHFFLTQGQVGTSVTSSGGQVDGDAKEQVKPSSTAGSVHVKGAATCGSTGGY